MSSSWMSFFFFNFCRYIDFSLFFLVNSLNKSRDTRTRFGAKLSSSTNGRCPCSKSCSFPTSTFPSEPTPHTFLSTTRSNQTWPCTPNAFLSQTLPTCLVPAGGSHWNLQLPDGPFSSCWLHYFYFFWFPWANRYSYRFLLSFWWVLQILRVPALWFSNDFPQAECWNLGN